MGKSKYFDCPTCGCKCHVLVDKHGSDYYVNFTDDIRLALKFLIESSQGKAWKESVWAVRRMAKALLRELK